MNQLNTLNRIIDGKASKTALGDMCHMCCSSRLLLVSKPHVQTKEEQQAVTQQAVTRPILVVT